MGCETTNKASAGYRNSELIFSCWWRDSHSKTHLIGFFFHSCPDFLCAPRFFPGLTLLSDATMIIRSSRFSNTWQQFFELQTKTFAFSSVTLASTLHYLIWVMCHEIAHCEYPLSEHWKVTLSSCLPDFFIRQLSDMILQDLAIFFPHLYRTLSRHQSIRVDVKFIISFTKMSWNARRSLN